MLKPVFLSLCFGLALACASPSGQIQGSLSELQSQVAVYPCSPELQAVIEEHGLPMRGSAAARASRILVPVQEGHFRLDNLAPGRYYVESPPLYYPGENPSIDQIFAGGGCVYFPHRQSRLVEVVAGQTTEVELK